MAMLAKAGVFAKSTAAATASQPVSGIGFTPNLVLFYTVGASALDTWANHVRMCVGYAANDSGTIKERALSIGIEDAAATSSSSRGIVDTKCIYLHGGTASLLAAADMTSFDSDGFTLSWTTNNAIAHQIGYLALQVPSVAVRNFNTAATGSGTITGLSFDPTAILVMANNGTSYQTTASTVDVFWALGAAGKGSGQWATALMDDQGQATINSNNLTRTDRFFSMPNAFGGAASSSNQIEITSFDTGGITYNVTNHSAARAVEVLLIGGVEAFAETFNKATAAATTTNVRTGYGFQPKAALVSSTSHTTSVNSADHLRHTLGFSDGTNEVSGTIYDTDNLADSNANSFITTSKAIGLNTSDSDAIAATADLSFQSGGLTFSWTTNDANAFEIVVLALGDAPVVALDAVVTASATVAAALTVSKPLVSVVAANATVVAALTVSKPLTSVVAASATVTADLTVAKPLSATVSASATITAALTVAKPLASLVTAQAALTASLDVAKPLAAVVGTSAALTADLTVAKPLAAIVATHAATAADLTVAKPLAATIATTATIAADLTIPLPPVLISTIAAGAAISADLTVAKPLAATVAATSSVVALLDVAKPLASTVTAQSVIAADLTVAKPLDAAIVIAATIAGALTVPKPLAAIIGPTAVLFADLTIPIPADGFLTADLTSDHVLSAVLDALWPLTASLDAGYVLTARLEIAVDTVAYPGETIRVFVRDVSHVDGTDTDGATVTIAMVDHADTTVAGVGTVVPVVPIDYTETTYYADVTAPATPARYTVKATADKSGANWKDLGVLTVEPFGPR